MSFLFIVDLVLIIYRMRSNNACVTEYKFPLFKHILSPSRTSIELLLTFTLNSGIIDVSLLADISSRDVTYSL